MVHHYFTDLRFSITKLAHASPDVEDTQTFYTVDVVLWHSLEELVLSEKVKDFVTDVPLDDNLVLILIVLGDTCPCRKLVGKLLCRRLESITINHMSCPNERTYSIPKTSRPKTPVTYLRFVRSIRLMRTLLCIFFSSARFCFASCFSVVFCCFSVNSTPANSFSKSSS